MQPLTGRLGTAAMADRTQGKTPPRETHAFQASRGSLPRQLPRSSGMPRFLAGILTASPDSALLPIAARLVTAALVVLLFVLLAESDYAG